MAENEENTSVSLIEFFGSEVSGAPSKTLLMAQRALSSLNSFLKGRNVSFDNDPTKAIREWLVYLKLNSLSWKSAVSYFNAVSGLFSRAVAKGITGPEPELRDIKALLVKNDGEIWKDGLSESGYEKLLSLTITSFGGCKNHPDIALDLLLFSLINGTMPLQDVARIKSTAIDAFDEESKKILLRHKDDRFHYVFRLRQSKRTPNQLAQDVSNLISNLFQKYYLPAYGNADQTIATYWAYAALRHGLSPGNVQAIVGSTAKGLPILSLCPPEELTADEKANISKAVGSSFLTTPLRWYVMRLRTHVKYRDLTRWFDDHKDEAARPELFYPCDEIYKRIGKKLVAETRPVIPDIVFFKTREPEIFPLFCKIGAMAYCYTVSGKSGDPYAPVPEQSFKSFQSTIGHFTPDYEVSPIGSIPLKEGDVVKIIGGDYRNNSAKIEKINPPDAQGRIIYRLMLLNTGFEWTLLEDSRLVTKASEVMTAE